MLKLKLWEIGKKIFFLFFIIFISKAFSFCSANVTTNILPGSPTQTSYAISGQIKSLNAGNSITLLNNSGNSLSITNSSGVTADFPFSFSTKLSAQDTYNVTVSTQPSGQFCVVGAGIGTVISSDITNIVVTCSSSTLYTIGGNVTGLLGTGLVLQNNGGDNLPIGASGAFTFATPLANGSLYNISILTQPTGPAQTCTISNASGVVSSANVTGIGISCSITSYQISGTMTGLTAGDQVILTNNYNDYTSVITSSGGSDPFYFNRAVNNGDFYSIFISSSTPSNRTCGITSGTVSGSDIVLALSCQTTYYVGGTVSSTIAGKNITLTNNGGNATGILTSLTPVAYQFSVPLVNSAAYNVAVSSIPNDTYCNFNPPGSQTGTISAANATVNLSCGLKCGNGVIDFAETCDDGNTTSGDGCSGTCQTEGSFNSAAAANFDTPSMDGWTTTGLWHLSNVRSQTPSYSVRFADPYTNNFSTGATVTGALTSQAFTLGLTGQMSFYYFHNGECLAGTTCSYDRLSVEVSTDGGSTWFVIEYLPDAETGLIYHNTNLSAYLAQSIMVRFYFNSVDSAANTYEGSYIDNIIFY